MNLKFAIFQSSKRKRTKSKNGFGPAVHVAKFSLEEAANWTAEQPLPFTFFDTRCWGHGILVVNDFVVGRYWPLVGPQVGCLENKCQLRLYSHSHSDESLRTRARNATSGQLCGPDRIERSPEGGHPIPVRAIGHLGISHRRSHRQSGDAARDGGRQLIDDDAGAWM
jgi:hypothetical protein